MESAHPALGARALGKWGRPGVPQNGWHCANVEDLGEPSQECEMCERQLVRYIHYMEHPSYEGRLSVGCVCAGYMEGDLEAAQSRERSLRRSPREISPDALSWVKAADAILSHAEVTSDFSDREISFVRDMRYRFIRQWLFEPTVRQRDWFVAIYKKMGRA